MAIYIHIETMCGMAILNSYDAIYCYIIAILWLPYYCHICSQNRYIWPYLAAIIRPYIAIICLHTAILKQYRCHTMAIYNHIINIYGSGWSLLLQGSDRAPSGPQLPPNPRRACCGRSGSLAMSLEPWARNPAPSSRPIRMILLTIGMVFIPPN